MTERIPLPDDVVGFIKAVVNQDRRERHAAGYKLGSYYLAHRLAADLGLKLETVLKIKERKRRKHVPAARILQTPVTVEPEKLEKIRQRRIRWGQIAASWRGWNPALWSGRWSYRKRLRTFRIEPEGPDKSPRPRRRSQSPKQS